ncbi:MAG: GNAT family N-acetyltransferase [Dehalococcoidia bacterium]|nr:MAG: GNAT family N-acetyltransferase [Dehalococcoidia bacterium]
MDRPALTFADAAPRHFDAILRIERDAGPSSVVTLTAGQALEEALERGHYVLVALDADDVAGWAWFTVDGSRGGEEVAQLFRVAVAAERRRTGVGRALIEHAQAVLAERDCTRMRAALAGDDHVARSFLAALGYAVDTVTMERPL